MDVCMFKECSGLILSRRGFLDDELFLRRVVD